MASSFQKARRYREKLAQGEASLPPLPDKPENVRFGVVFLYSACAVALVFLIITGDILWTEAAAEEYRHLRTVMVQMLAAGVAEGLAGFLLSRCWRWPLYLVWVLVIVNAGFLAWYGADLFAFSPGLFVSRLLSLLMDAAAVIFFLSRSGREWFELLRQRRQAMHEKALS